MTLDELLLVLPFNYDYFKRLANFYVETTEATPLTVDFTGTPTSGPQALTVQFTSTVSGGDNSAYTYHWNFGDGGTSTEANPSYEYPNQGTWSVSLIVSDGTGIQAGEARTDYITVTPAAPPPAEDQTEGESNGY